MGKRFDIMLWPDGLKKAFTLSYDDGVIQDRRLVELLNNFGIKATFNINYGLLGQQQIVNAPNHRPVDVSKINKEEVVSLYRNHEVAGHGLYHSSLVGIKSPLVMYEITEDKRALEKLIEKPLQMFAYPFGFFNEAVKIILAKAGYKGARTVVSTGDFNLPEDFLQWNPTCHHNDPNLMELLKKFVEEFSMSSKLFYLWGHAYEFDGDDNWQDIEKALEYIAQDKENIWFATNGEIMDYIWAYNRLEYSVDGSMIYNPSAVDVYIQTSFGQTEILKAGELTKIKETPL